MNNMTISIKKSANYTGQTISFKNLGRGGGANLKMKAYVPPPDIPPSSAPVPATYLSLPVVARCVPDTGLGNVLNNVAWYYVQLTETRTVTFDTEGSSPSDTKIAVYDDTGAKLGEDDDSGTGALSTLTLSGLTAGLYYVAVSYYPISFYSSVWANSGGVVTLVDNCSLKLNITLI